jgi:predicted GIY-YIG superfamily endonuclease
MVYHIYEASFETKLGSKRRYIGLTTDLASRQRTLLSSKRPVWMKAGCAKLKIWVLVQNIQTRGAALAVEALMTARRWKSTRFAVRGGPWVRPTLSAKDEQELESVARCKSVRDVLLAAASGSGKLSLHLKGLTFSAAESARSSGRQPSLPRTSLCPQRCLPCPRPSASSMARVVKRRASGKSGCCGHVWREQSGIRYGTARHTRAKWGKQGLRAKRCHQETWRRSRPT